MSQPAIKVLYVDDDKQTLDAVARSLGDLSKMAQSNKERGIELVTVNSVEAARAQLKAAQPPFDIVMTDYNMGPFNPDGVTFAKEIRHPASEGGLGMNVPIILYSAESASIVLRNHPDFNTLGIIPQDKGRGVMALYDTLVAAMQPLPDAKGMYR